MSDLKPCPFCGGEAATNTIIYSAKDDVVKLNGQDMFFGVNCIKCGVNNRGLVGYKTEDEAIEAWNTRPKSEAEELLEFQEVHAMSVVPVNVGDWNATGDGISVYGPTPLDALRAAREAMKDD